MKHIQSDELVRLLANQKPTPRWLAKARFAYRTKSLRNLSADGELILASLCGGFLLALAIILIVL